MGVPPPVGTLGSIVNTDNGLFTRHRYAMMCTFIVVLYAVAATCRAFVPAVKRLYPLRTKHTVGDVMSLWVGIAMLAGVYLTKVDTEEPRFVELDVLENRLTYAVYGVIACSALQYLYRTRVFSFLDEAACATQASNGVRLTVKLVALFYYVFIGDFLHIMRTHPLEVGNEEFRSSHVVMHMLGAMYLWELLFRDLRPVNVIHHAVTLCGICSTFEWQSVVEPPRILVCIPMMGALSEAVCCLGTMAYRFAPRGRALKRFMLAEAVYVVVVYNLLLVAYIARAVTYHEITSDGWLCVMPVLSLFTYPAQMNMARVFYSLSKKAGKPAKAAVQPADEAAKAEMAEIARASKAPGVVAASVSVTHVKTTKTIKSVGTQPLTGVQPPEMKLFSRDDMHLHRRASILCEA